MAPFDKTSGEQSGDGCPSGAISCQEALRLVHDFLDGELEGVTPAEVKAHFDVCQRCYPHLRFEQAFREAMRRACAREAAPAQLRDRLEKMLAEAAERS